MNRFDDQFCWLFNFKYVKCGMGDFYKQIQPYIPALRGIVERYRKRTEGEFSKSILSFDEMKKLSLMFFRDTDEFMADRVTRALEAKETIKKISEPCAENEGKANCVGVNENHVREVTINPTNDVEGLFTMTHEFGHLASERMQERVSPKEDLLGEIESKFSEKLYADWLLESGVISKEDWQLKQNRQRQDLVYDCEIILQENELLSTLKFPITPQSIEEYILSLENNPNRDVLIDRLKILALGRKSGNDLWGLFVMRYIIGEMTACILYDEYKSAPLSVISRFNDFLANSARLDLIDGIKMLLGEDYIEKVNATFLPPKQEEKS